MMQKFQSQDQHNDHYVGFIKILSSATKETYFNIKKIIPSSTLKKDKNCREALIECALRYADFDFALNLIKDNIEDFYDMFHASRLFFLRLMNSPDHSESYSSLLFLSLIKRHNLLIMPRSFEPQLVKLMTLKIYTAIVTFINPLQNTLHNDFSVVVRLKLATTYLVNELYAYIWKLPLELVEKVLLQRLLDYVTIVVTKAFIRTASNFIQSNISIIPKHQVISILSAIGNEVFSRMCFYDKEMRTSFFLHIKNLVLSDYRPNNPDNFRKLINSITLLAKTWFQNPRVSSSSPLLNTVNLYFLHCHIRARNNSYFALPANRKRINNAYYVTGEVKDEKLAIANHIKLNADDLAWIARQNCNMELDVSEPLEHLKKDNSLARFANLKFPINYALLNSNEKSLLKLLLQKIARRMMLKHIVALEAGRNPKRIKRLLKLNYNILVTSFNVRRIPHSKPLQSGSIFLSDDEFSLYERLLSMKWQLAHGVANSLAMAKIKADGEIRAPRLRKMFGENLTNLRTVATLESFNFFTLAPLKAPLPRFLKNAAKITFDVEGLIRQHPHIFKNAYLAPHWYAFAKCSNFMPISYMGTTVSTSYNKQMKLDTYAKGKFINVFHEDSDNFLGGARLIHIFCLLFIQKLYLIGGCFYDTALYGNMSDQWLAKAFSICMYPGLEILIPYSVPLGDYCAYQPALNLKVLNSSELERASKDLGFFKKCLAEGFDITQTTMIPLTMNKSTLHYRVDFFSLAILNQHRPVIDFLLANDFDYVFETVSGALSPVDAANHVKDYDTLYQLLTVGITISDLPGVKRLFDRTKSLLDFLLSLNAESLIMLFSRLRKLHDIYHQTINDFLLAFITHLTDLKYRDKLVKLIATGLNACQSSDPNYSNDNEKYLIDYAVESSCNEVIVLFFKFGVVKNSHYMKQFLQDNNTKLIELIVDTLEEDIANSDLFLLLYMSNQKPLIDKAISYLSLDNCSNMEQFFNKLHLFETQEDFFSFWRDYGTLKKASWINIDRFNFIFDLIFNSKEYCELREPIECYECVEDMMEHLSIQKSLLAQYKFIVSQKLRYESIILRNFFSNRINDDTNRQEVIEFFNYLHVDHLMALTWNKISTNILVDIGIGSSFRHLLHNADFMAQAKLIDLFCDEKIFIRLLSNYKQNYDLDNLAVWLIRAVNNDRYLKFFQGSSSKDLLAAFIRTNYIELLASSAFSEYDKVYVNRCLLFMKSFIPSINLTITPDTYYWGKHHNLINDVEMFDDSKSDAKEFWDGYYKSLDDKNKNSTSSIEKCRYATASFITCIVDCEMYVYLGQKKMYGRKYPQLLAPGGFYDPAKESFLQGAIREIEEETRFKVHISEIAEHEFETTKMIHIVKSKTPLKPTAIELLTECKSVCTQECSSKDIKFLRFNFTGRFISFSSSDDFADGRWIPVTQIKRDALGRYFYGSMQVLQSNGMLIDYIQNKYLGTELFEAVVHKDNAEMAAFSISTSSFFFSKLPTSNTLPTPPTDSIINANQIWLERN